MKAVGSGLERGHDDGSSGAAELSGSHAGLDAKLVNRVSRRKENDGVDQGFVVVNSIEDEIVVLGTQAIDGKGGAASFAVAEGFRVAACARRRGVGHAASDVGFESGDTETFRDRKSTRLNSSHRCISYAVFCLKKKNKTNI